MNLTEIEKAVRELSFRHPGLTKEFLRTLLEASGWEEKHIKEALSIYVTQLPIAPLHSDDLAVKIQPSPTKEDFLLPSSSVADEGTTSSTNNSTLLHSDEAQEGVLHVNDSIETIHNKTEETVTGYSSKETKDIKENVEQKTVDENIILSQKEEESLVKEDTHIKSQVQKIKTELPDNLPLVPFESSPHIWSFARYKDTFYQESKTEESKIETATKVTSDVAEKQKVPVPPLIIEPIVVNQVLQAPEPVLPTSIQKIEIDFKKTPISKAEESLVVLAGIMLLAIMLILGYMYGIGRL